MNDLKNRNKQPIMRVKQPIMHVIKNNTFMNTSKICGMMLNEYPTFSDDAKKFLRVPEVFIGTHTIQARIGTFNNPWGSKTLEWYAPHPFTFTTESLADIADQRAIELVNVAKHTNRKIIIMWSGGIDSTLVLTSFLKNISEADQELLTIACTAYSIADNTNFYLKFLSNNKKINLINATDLCVNDELLNTHLVLHGDPGDGVFGPSTGMYTYFSNNNLHLEPWRKHLKTIAKQFEPNVERDNFVEPGMGSWLSDIVTRTLEESGQSDYISTVADWMWWTYFNFKWSYICQYPMFMTMLKPNHNGITLENQKFYAENVFFNTPQFQHWSYSNLKELIGSDVFKTHKLKAREYIYDFDKDLQYFFRKRKTGTMSPTAKMQKGGIIGYSKYFRPISITRKVKQVLCVILRRYKK